MAESAVQVEAEFGAKFDALVVRNAWREFRKERIRSGISSSEEHPRRKKRREKDETAVLPVGLVV